MGQLSFKIPDSEMEFLHWFSERTSQPIGALYRNATFDLYLEWKLEIILKEYQRGIIGFKQLCRLSSKSFQAMSMILQERDIEPAISEIMDEYTSAVRDSLTAKDVFKDGKVPKRISQPITPKEIDRVP